MRVAAFAAVVAGAALLASPDARPREAADGVTRPALRAAPEPRTID
jgi:hypothetical protein